MRKKYKIKATTEDARLITDALSRVGAVPEEVVLDSDHEVFSFYVNLSKYELLYVKLVGKFEGIICEDNPEIPL